MIGGGGCVRSVEMIRSWGERSSGSSWGEVEESGGVEGAGGSLSRSWCEEGGGALYRKFAETVVNDCENENTCRPSMWVKNSGKKRFSSCARERAV